MAKKTEVPRATDPFTQTIHMLNQAADLCDEAGAHLDAITKELNGMSPPDAVKRCLEHVNKVRHFIGAVPTT